MYTHEFINVMFTVWVIKGQRNWLYKGFETKIMFRVMDFYKASLTFDFHEVLKF